MDVAPSTVGDVLSLLKEHAPDARVLAGGRTTKHRTERLQQTVLAARIAQINAPVRLGMTVAACAMTIHDGLDQPFVSQQPIIAPRWRSEPRGSGRHRQRRPPVADRHLALAFVTAAATAYLAMLQADKRPHPPHFHHPLVQQLKVDRRVGRYEAVERPRHAHLVAGGEIPTG